MGDISRRILERIGDEIETRLGVECILCAGAELPAAGYHVIRGQYSGEVLLRELEKKYRVEAGCKHLGVVDVDLYAGRLNFIFGIAQVGGDFAAISLYRLKYGAGEELLLERALKEALHELGHTFGFGHCPRRKCVMSFSNSLEEVDAKGADFCEAHRARIPHVQWL